MLVCQGVTVLSPDILLGCGRVCEAERRVLVSSIAAAIQPQTFATLELRNGPRRVFTGQADIDAKRREIFGESHEE